MTAPPIQSQSQYVIEAQATTVAAMSTQARAAIAAYILSFIGNDSEHWYDTGAITEMTLALARLNNSFAANAARQIDAFVADAIATLDGKKFRTQGVRNTLGVDGEKGVREGVTTAGVFGRAADTYRYQQSALDKQFLEDVRAGAPEPTELVTPLDAAVSRAGRAAETNVALAMRNQARTTLVAAGDRVIGYRRVMHAELDKTGSCGLCIADSSRIYRSDHLMPMHPGCHCIPVPVTANHDPGAIINAEDLGRFYDEAGGTSAEALRATRYKVDDHGEIGPVLRPHGDPIRTAEQARADTNRPRRPKTDAERVRTLKGRRDKLEQATKKLPGGLSPAWATRLDGVSKRIHHLDRQIVRLGG